MTNNSLQTQQSDASIIESVVIGGDLSKLTPSQRVQYYQAVCHSLGLNPLTKPFDYITLNNRLTLYARKDATDQLRKIHNISIDKPDIQFVEDWIIVTVLAADNTGRKDSDVGVVSRKDMQGAFGNSLMKAVTKAKRRVTLSICGLGMLDESEVETIPNAKPVVVEETGEIVEAEMTNPDPVSPKGRSEWNELGNQAVKAGVAVPVVDFDRVTQSELREMWIALNKKVKIAEESKRLDGG